MPHRILVRSTGGKKLQKSKPEGAKPPLEVGNRRLFTIANVRAQLDMHSREAFKEVLSLFLGAHPTEQDIISFASRNPDKWAGAVNLVAKLAGYNDTLEINHNIYATVTQMSDMDLEHQLRDVNHKIGDSHLVDPTVLETPYKRIDDAPRAVKRISAQPKPAKDFATGSYSKNRPPE